MNVSELNNPRFIRNFWAKVVKYGNPDGCWVWSGYRSDGYGRFSVRSQSQKHYFKTHRMSWELAFGDIPDGMCVLHHCDNRACVNPEHLFLGTNYDNVQDRHSKGRTSIASRNLGDRNGNRKLDSIDIPIIRSSHLPQKELARLFSVSAATICMVKNKIRWEAVK